MPTSRRSLRRRGASRRPVTWNQKALQFSLGLAGTTVFADLTPQPLAISGEIEHGTAVLQRMLLTFDAYQEGTVINVPQRFAVGMYVSTNAAISATTVLNPLGNVDQDWVYWTARSLFLETSANPGIHWEVDLRGKRKLRGGFGFVIVVQPDASNTSELELTVGMRLLWAISN